VATASLSWSGCCHHHPPHLDGGTLLEQSDQVAKPDALCRRLPDRAMKPVQRDQNEGRVAVTGCLRGGHAATSSCGGGGGRASSDGRWRFLGCLRRGLLAGGFFDRFCIHVQMVWNRPLTMATATALAPLMRAAATMGSSNLMGTSTTPGQATTSRVPASHAPCLILSLIGAFSGKPSGRFHRQTRCPGSRHRKSTSRARPACLVHARRAWLREPPGRRHRQDC